MTKIAIGLDGRQREFFGQAVYRPFGKGIVKMRNVPFLRGTFTDNRTMSKMTWPCLDIGQPQRLYAERKTE